jgi:hypothetical protein
MESAHERCLSAAIPGRGCCIELFFPAIFGTSLFFAYLIPLSSALYL